MAKTSSPQSSKGKSTADSGKKQYSRQRNWLRWWRAPEQSPTGEIAALSYYVLLIATSILLILGLIMVFSTHSVSVTAAGGSVYNDFARYVVYAVVGLVVMVAMSHIPPHLFDTRFIWGVFGVSLLLQLLVFVPGLGVCVYGNCNWISVAGLGTIQPSEFLKLTLALVLGHAAGTLADPERKRLPLIAVVSVIVAAVGSVLFGGDLGTVIVMALLVAGAAWMGGLRKRWFALLGLVGALGVSVATMLSANRRARIAAWWHPDQADVTGIAYQPMHGRWALATGGLDGVGPSGSRQKWGYLTQADSDYIFAVLGEEFGFIGTFLVVLTFCALAFAMFRVMRRYNDLYVTVVTGGIISWIIGQAAINMGVVTGLLPVLGVPLPLMSAGGSSLISVLAAIGVILAFARNEPGARAAFSSRPSAVRRTLAVIAPRRRKRD